MDGTIARGRSSKSCIDSVERDLQGLGIGDGGVVVVFLSQGACSIPECVKSGMFIVQTMNLHKPCVSTPNSKLY